MPVYRLHTKQDVESLTKKVGLFERPASFRVELLCSSVLPSNRKHKLEQRLAFALSDCGCALASLSIILSTLFLYFGLNYSPLPFWPNTVIYFVYIISIASFTKLVSLYLTYHLAHNILREIRSSLLPDNSAENVELGNNKQ